MAAWEERAALRRQISEARSAYNAARAQLIAFDRGRALAKLKRLPPQQRAVMSAMIARSPSCEYGYHFKTICADTQLDRAAVCRACRALRRLGFLTFMRGMWTEDGEPAGSGYGLTKAGLAWWIGKETLA